MLTGLTLEAAAAGPTPSLPERKTGPRRDAALWYLSSLRSSGGRIVALHGFLVAHHVQELAMITTFRHHDNPNPCNAGIGSEQGSYKLSQPHERRGRATDEKNVVCT